MTNKTLIFLPIHVPRRQLEAVMSARILVGGHGAALANIIATEPGAAALLEVIQCWSSDMTR